MAQFSPPSGFLQPGGSGGSGGSVEEVVSKGAGLLLPRCLGRVGLA